MKARQDVDDMSVWSYPFTYISRCIITENSATTPQRRLLGYTAEPHDKVSLVSRMARRFENVVETWRGKGTGGPAMHSMWLEKL